MSRAAIPDDAWLSVLARTLRGDVAVVGRAGLAGGYASGGVERVDLTVDGLARSVVVKPAGAVEVAALRAVAVVPGLDAPVLATGAGWAVLPFHDGPALAGGPAVPGEVPAMLARVHAHWLGKRPRAVPVADGAWWRALCARVRPAVVGAGTRSGDAVFTEVAAALAAWADDPRALAAAAVLPRTLVHGDPHRGNILLDPAGAALIDWGNALVAPAAFDLAVLRAEGPVDLTAYLALAAAPTPAEDAWARLAMPDRYLGFAADHLGPARVAELAGMAEQGLADLGPALGPRP